MTQFLPSPEACSHTMDAVLIDPLEPGAGAEAHLRACRACAEARVAFLAQEETPEVLAPAEYFERLPDRVLRKLPARSRLHLQMGPLAWAAAAALLMAVGAGAFWAGRANRTPLVEATLPRQPDLQETVLTLPDTPFHDQDEDAAQVRTLTPAEMKVLLKRLDAPPASER